MSASPPLSPASGKEGKAGNGGTRVVCTAPGCNQSFSNASELAVHKQKHQMTLKLGPSRAGLADMLPFDQTPTPTKFLQYGKETGLFDEISNPFDNEFKRGTSQGQSLKEKARRSALPQLVINSQMNKARTPTSYPSSSQLGFAPVAQPVHVITLTPTLPSPVGAIPGSQFFLPSPQGFMPSPLAGPPAIISPSIVPFSAGLPFPTMQQVVEAQQAAIAQAFLNAANATSVSQPVNNHQHQSNDVTTSGHHFSASRTSSTDQSQMSSVPFPTQTVSVPVHNNATPPNGHAISAGQNMASAPVGSASVIQQHGQVGIDQRRPLTQSNSLDHTSHAISSNLQRKSSFPGETSVITQAPPNSSAATQMNTNMNMHTANSVAYQYMDQQQNTLPPFPQSDTEASRMVNHPVLTATRSMPAQSNVNMQNMPHLPHQNSLPNIDAKQKLKETLTSNNPNLQVNMPGIHILDIDDEMNRQNEVSSSSGNDTKTPGRRRGRQSDLDPDQKRMRFLERNRAAASRCRAKKKQWVCGLEVKAKELNNSNIGLQNEVASLREEVASLKQLLLAHRDCPITRVQQQKLGIVGKDPASVVSNPVQAAASLLAFSSENQSDTASNTVITSVMGDDVKPNPVHMTLGHTTSNGSIGGDNQVSSNSNTMPTSVLVNSQVIGKAEPPSSFPTMGQSADLMAAGMNNNGYSSSSSLSTASSS